MSFLDKGKKDEKKAVVRVLEIDSDGEFEKEELGFGVKMKKHEKSDCFFIITSSSVLRSPLYVTDGSKIVVDRYCSQYPNHIDNKDHRSEVDKVESCVDEDLSFVYCRGGRKEEFLEFYDEFHKELHRSLFAYAFDDKEMIELTFEDKFGNNDYKLIRVSKRGFQVKRAKGAPIIVYDPYSEEPKVVGIVGVQKNGDLYPVFVTKRTFAFRADNINPKEQGDASSFASNKKENGSSKSSTDETKPIKEIDEFDSPITSQEKEGQHSSNPSNDKNGTVSKEKESVTQKNNEQDPSLCSDEIDRAVHPTDLQGKGKAPLIVTGLTDNQKDKQLKSVFSNRSECMKFMKINDAVLKNLINKLQIKLDPERPFGGDIFSLAGEFGYNNEYIIYLKNQQYPTQTLVQHEGSTTLKTLRDKLQTIERNDAAELIDNFIKSNCDCEDCGNLR